MHLTHRLVGSSDLESDSTADCLVACAGYLFRNAQYRLDLHRSMDDGEAAAAQLPSAGFQAEPLAVSAAESSSAAQWDGYAEGSQKTHVQVRAAAVLACLLSSTKPSLTTMTNFPQQDAAMSASGSLSHCSDYMCR